MYGGVKPNSILDLNNSEGLDGEVLTSTSTGIIWASEGQATTNLNPIFTSVNTGSLEVTGAITDSTGSVGTAGQVLTSNATSALWETPASGTGTEGATGATGWSCWSCWSCC